MLGLLLDAGAMYGVIAIVSGDTPEFLTALLTSLGFAIVMGLSLAFLGPIVGMIALLPVVLLFGVVLSALFGMPLKQAVLGAAIFLGYKVLMVFAWAALLS